VNAIEWCKQKIQEAQEAADYQAWENYQAMLAVWEKRFEE
jgi:hypothetical protein